MMTDSETPAAPPGFLPMSMEKPSLTGVMFFGLGQGVVTGLCIVALRDGLNLPDAPAVLIMVPIMMLYMKAVRTFTHRRLERSIGLILARDPNPQMNIRTATERLGSNPLTFQPISVMTRAMGKIGRIGNTYQLWWKAEPDPVEPLTMTFEPRLLDEADVGFDELAMATASEPGAARANAPEASGLREDVLDMRRVQRNFKLMGWAGWIILCGLSIYLVGSGIDSVQRHTMTWQFSLGVCCLLLFLFAPRQTGWFATNHWLLVPGGVLHRKAKSRDRKVTLHLFDRRRSIMTIYQLRNRSWLLTVADAEASQTTSITDRERQLLLRAWLSPVAPPPVEQLVDLS